MTPECRPCGRKWLWHPHSHIAYLQVDAGLIASHVWGLQLLYQDDDDADEEHKVHLSREGKAKLESLSSLVSPPLNWTLSRPGKSPCRLLRFPLSHPKEKKEIRKRILCKNLEMEYTRSKSGGEACLGENGEKAGVMEKHS